tara:strand:+ start:1318 stop:3321 length:2004 start_codon:yes stop_codon:yes gene_type:complete
MANKVVSTNEIYLNGTYFPIERPVQSVLASIYPSKVVIGDTSKDSQLRSSIIAWSDWRGGIGIDRMEGGEVNRAWWSDCQLRYKNHLVLGNYANATDTHAHGLAKSGEGTGIAAINEFKNKIYAVWNGSITESPKMFVYNNTSDYWWDGRVADQAIGVNGSDSFGVPDQVTDSLNYTDRSNINYLVLAHYDTNGSGYSYATVPSYDGTNPAAWTNNAKDTKYIAEWDGKLWGISHAGQLWHALAPGSETDDALLPLPEGYVTGLFVARDSRGEPILYAATKQGLWAHDAMHAKFVKTEMEFPFHPHAGKGTTRWRDSIYFPSGLGLYKYINGSNNAVLTVVGPDRDDGLPADNRGTIMLAEGTHNELLVGVDSTTNPTVTSADSVPYQWNMHHFGSPVIDNATGYSSILGYNELGWEAKWVASTAGRKIDAMHVSNAYSDLNENYRLWWGFNDRVYYMKLPVDIINPSKVTEFEYKSSGVHETPWFNAGQSEIEKLALQLKVEVQDSSSTETVQVQYATDYAESYTSMGTINSNGITTYTFGSNVGTAFRSIKFKLTLARTTNTGTANYLKKSPDVVSMTLIWRKKLEAKWGHQVGVSLNRDYKGKTPKQLRSALISAIESSTLVEFTFRDDDSTNRNYYVDVTSATGLESTGYDERGSSTIMLVEP